MSEKEFVEELKKINIDITEEQLLKLEKFYNLLIEWNKKINLTRIIEKKEVFLKHFYDSLTIVKAVDLNKVKSLCDVGTGAGFPGIVLKIVYPNLEIVLVDSLLKRVKYLNIIIEEMELKGIKAIHSRGEDYKGEFDVVTSRAVANINKLLDYTMHLVKKEGVFIALKGDIDTELTEESKKNINQKYGEILVKKFYLPFENSKRSLVVIKK